MLLRPDAPGDPVRLPLVLLLALPLALAAAGCTRVEAGPGGDEPGGDEPGGDEIDFTGFGTDGEGGEGGGGWTPPPDDDPGTPAPDTGDEPDAPQPPEVPATCESWQLVPGPAGYACAPECGEGGLCPDGYRCTSVSLPDGAVVQLCLQGHPTLCQPCEEHADCNLLTGATGHLCTPREGAGSFCATRCDQGLPSCPAGYTCAPGWDAADQPASTCLPDDGTCECSALGGELEMSTPCQVGNDLGLCLGERVCAPGAGLTGCSAQVPTEESCNEVDDDCDGATDEGVQSPCGGCGEVCTFEVTPGAGGVIDVAGGGISGGGTQGGEVLEHPFIWIANSAEDTVSRLDTTNGCEVARYYVCGNPSRTAVDFQGSGIIACRGDGGVAKIAVLEDYCVDANGNGTIDTSRDLDGDCEITDDEMVQGDECILWTVHPDGPSSGCSGSAGCARAAGVDADGHLWIGMWNSKRLWRIRGDTGESMVQLPMSVRPYGLAIDSDQRIWVASRDPSAVALVDPAEGELGWWSAPSGHAYGLAVDPFGAVWLAGGEAGGVARFDPFSETWLEFPETGLGNTRGVAIKIDYDALGSVQGARVYVAHHSWPQGCSASGEHRYVSVIDAGTLAALPPVDLGSDLAPVGVAIDSAGQLWAVNQCDSSATRVDTTTNQVLGTYPVGLSPYTYSDMTGYALKTITAVKIDFSYVFEGWPGGATRWQSITADVTVPNFTSYVEVQYRIGLTKEELAGADWYGPFGPYPPQQFPVLVNLIAPLLEVRITGFAESNANLPKLTKISVKAKLE